jgi:hypothetical protein
MTVAVGRTATSRESYVLIPRPEPGMAASISSCALFVGLQFVVAAHRALKSAIACSRLVEYPLL